MATRRVLVVDDEAEVRKALAGILRAMRYPDALEIEEVADGQAGLDAVIRQRPDLILLDLHMPRMSGLTLLEHIRDVETREPIIVVSAPRTARSRRRRCGTARAPTCWSRSIRATWRRSSPRSSTPRRAARASRTRRAEYARARAPSARAR